MMKSLLAVLLGLLPAAALAVPPRYSVTPASGKYDHAIGLNNSGVFAVNNADANVPYRTGYLTDGTMHQDVGTLGGNGSVVLGLNNRNEAVGDSTTADGSRHAFLYAGGRMHDLSALYGLGTATATAINDRGDIGGTIAPFAGNGRAVVLRGGQVQVIDRPNGTVIDINEAGDVVGNYLSGGQRMFHTSQGVPSDVGIPGSQGIQAAGINDAGALAGTYYGADARLHAFLDVAGRVTDLAPPLTSSTAYGINNLGEVVGTVSDRAFLYADGKLIDLNALVDPDAHVLLTSALAINDREQILAKACDAQGVFCYATLRLDPVSAVPEAPRARMLLAGLPLLLIRCRKSGKGRTNCPSRASRGAARRSEATVFGP